MMMLGLLLAAIPFGFAVLRAAGTGTDLRYVWVALAAAVASWAVLIFGDRGARPTAGRVAVAFGFAICEAGGLSLVRRTR